jgi:hypothetical protein
MFLYLYSRHGLLVEEALVLESMAVNMPHTAMDQVISEIAKKHVLKNEFDTIDNHNQSLLNQKSMTAI